MAARYVHDSDGHLVVDDGHDYAAVATDSLDAASHAGKLPLDDLNGLAGAAGIVDVVEENNLVILCLREPHVAAHHSVGHRKNLVVDPVILIVDRMHDETERFEILPIALHLQQFGVRGTHENIVQEDWGEVHLVIGDSHETKWNIGLDSDILQAVESLLEFVQA